MLSLARKFSGLVNFVVFQAAWFACVVGAARGNMWVGPLAVLLAVPPQAIFLTSRPQREGVFLLLAGLSGFLAESAMTWAGVHEPVRRSFPWPMAPLWIVALWINFASAFPLSLKWMKRRYVLAALAGGFSGPLAFYAGERLGATTVHPEFWRGYGALGLVWALAVPGLFLIYDRLVEERTPP